MLKWWYLLCESLEGRNRLFEPRHSDGVCTLASFLFWVEKREIE